MKQLPRLLMDATVVVLAVLATIFCLTTAFSLTVSPLILIGVTLAAALLFTSCFLWKKALWLLIPVAAAVVLLGLFTQLFSSVGDALQQLLHDILTRFSSAYPSFRLSIPPEPTAYVSDNYTVLFSVLAVLLSVWMAWGVGYRSGLITIAGSLPFLLLCVMINDTPPHIVPLVMLLTAWTSILLAKERPNEPATMDAARLGLTLLCILLVFTVAGALYPKMDTHNQALPAPLQELLDHLPGPVQRVLSPNSSGFQDEELGADTSETLDLTKQGARDRKDTVMMQISSTETGVLYLRGAAKDIYTGTSWESRGETTTAESVYAHTSLGTAFGGSYQAAIQIHNYYDKATVAFVPYGFISCAGANSIVNDLRVPCYEDDYISYFWPGIQTLDLTTVGEQNPDYDSYVQGTCLELPEDTKQTLYQLALSYGYDPSLSTLDTIAWVAAFVRSVGTYQLDVSRQPGDQDFAVYFLTESKSGYCVHFATAAATMLRALGVPSRYASGYRVTIQETSTVTDIIDKNTHAWAEAYISGLGWIPLETTPGFGDSVTLPDVQREPQPSADPAPSPSVEPSPSLEPSPAPASAEPSEEPSQAQPSPEAAPEPATGVGSRLWLLLLIPLALILALIVLLLRHHLVLGRRLKQFHSGTRNDAVVRQWAYLEQLVPWGAVLPEEMEALALKAKFSQHTISQEELTKFTRSVQSLSRSTMAALTRGQRLRFRWLSCLDLKS